MAGWEGRDRRKKGSKKYSTSYHRFNYYLVFPPHGVRTSFPTFSPTGGKIITQLAGCSWVVYSGNEERGEIIIDGLISRVSFSNSGINTTTYFSPSSQPFDDTANETFLPFPPQWFYSEPLYIWKRRSVFQIYFIHFTGKWRKPTSRPIICIER